MLAARLIEVMGRAHAELGDRCRAAESELRKDPRIAQARPFLWWSMLLTRYVRSVRRPRPVANGSATITCARRPTL